MYELIYYSIPGIVVIVASYFWFLPDFSTDQAILLVSSSPVIGYACHQLFRFAFELTGGHWRKSRRIIKKITEEYSSGKNRIGEKSAFLIWELSIYAKEVSSHFLEHDARMWRFIISHWALSLTSFLTLLSLLIITKGDISSLSRVIIMIILLINSLLFFVVGHQVMALLNIQEEAYYLSNKTDFDKRAKVLAK